MSRQELLGQLAAYTPCNEQEERDRDLIAAWIAGQEDAFLRSNLIAHVTASAWVVDSDRTHVLMAWHNIYRSWSWLGGHADGETDLEQVALREVRQEAGITHVRPVSHAIYSVEALTVDGHEKRGAYVPSHLHLNITYLLEADSSDALKIKPDENSAVAWLTPEEALARSTEPWFVERIYAKLIGKRAAWELAHG